MFCEKCGSKLIEGACFCENCGHRVSSMPGQDIRMTAGAAKQNVRNKSRNNGHNKGIMAAVIIIAVLAVTGCAIGATILINNFMARGKEESASKTETHETTPTPADGTIREGSEPAYSLTREEEITQIETALGAPYINGAYETSFLWTGEYQITVESYGQPGFFGAYKDDYDQDGQQEYLAVSLGIGDNENELMYRLHMLEWDGSSWDMSDQVTVEFGNGAYSSNVTPTLFDFFLKNVDGKMKIFGEITGYASYFADGMFWCLTAYEYDGTQLIDTTLDKWDIAGSDVAAWEDLNPDEAYDDIGREAAQNFRDNVLSSGIMYQKIGYDTPAVSQDADTIPVGRCLKTDHVKSSDASALYGGSISRLQGVTVSFFDHDQVGREGVNAGQLTTSETGPDSSEGAATSQVAHRYEIVLKDTTWKKAWNDCIERGGHLATFETQEELQMMIDQINSQGLSDKIFYLGGKRKGDSEKYYWYGADDTKIGECLNSSDSWTNSWWMAGEPSFADASIKENRMDMFYYKDERRWVLNDIPNDIVSAVSQYVGRVAYICEYDS
ncbi:MAG: hypothetical protein EOM40_01580 [Clostridia bacterium]|nr:hypothetical protein [Clostridia bacterium]